MHGIVCTRHTRGEEIRLKCRQQVPITLLQYSEMTCVLVCVLEKGREVSELHCMRALTAPCRSAFENSKTAMILLYALKKKSYVSLHLKTPQ